MRLFACIYEESKQTALTKPFLIVHLENQYDAIPNRKR